MICDNRMSDYDPVICDDRHVGLWPLSSVIKGMSDYNPIICDNRHVRLWPYDLWWQEGQTVSPSFVAKLWAHHLWQNYEPIICGKTVSPSFVAKLWAHHLWQNITHLQHKEAAPAKRFMRTNVFTCIHIYEIYTREGNQGIYLQGKYHDQLCKMT